MEAVVMDTVAEAVHGIRKYSRGDDRAEDGQGDQDQGNKPGLYAAPGEFPDDADEDEYGRQPAAGHIGQGYQAGLDNPAGLVAFDERAQGGAGKRQDEGNGTAEERAFVAIEGNQCDDRKKTQDIGNKCAPAAQGPCQQLDGAKQDCQDGCADRSIVAELSQEPAGPVRQPAGNGGETPSLLSNLQKSSAHASTANNKQKGYSLGSGADQPGNDQYDGDRNCHDGCELHVGGDFDLRHYESPGILDAFGTVKTNPYKALIRGPPFLYDDSH